MNKSIERSFIGLSVRWSDDLLFSQRPAGGHEPLFPCCRGLEFIFGD
jgi:hypothetical protein